MISKYEIEKCLVSTRYIDECFNRNERLETFGEVEANEAVKENLSIQESDN